MVEANKEAKKKQEWDALVTQLNALSTRVTELEGQAMGKEKHSSLRECKHGKKQRGIQDDEALSLIQQKIEAHEKMLNSMNINLSEPQTIESLNLLKMRNTEFIVALNKIDRLYGWKVCRNAPIVKAMKQQSKDVQFEFNTRLTQIVTQFKEQGINTELYYKIKEMGKDTFSIIPTSAIRRESESLWGHFCNWITSTENRLYIGWFGVLMIPTLLTTTSEFIIAFIAAPPVDIDGIREPVSGSLLYRNNIISGAIIPTSAAIACYMGHEWELSFRLGMQPWIAVAYSAHVAAATAVFLIYPIGQGRFSDGMALGNSGTFNFMIVFQAEHNILMHSFHMLGVAGVFGGSLFSAMHGSLVTSSLIRETTENESANEGYIFGQEEETYNIVAAHGYFGRLIFQYASFNNSRSLHFFLAAWPVVGIWFTALGISTMAFNLNGFNFNQSVVDSQGRVINTWADIINRANLGMEVMHERRLPSQRLDPALPKLFWFTPTFPTCPSSFWISNGPPQKCTVLEVKAIEGHGTTIDVVLINGPYCHLNPCIIDASPNEGTLNKGTKLCVLDAFSFDYLGSYLHHKEIKAAQGININAQGLEYAIAGTSLYVVGPDDDVEHIKEAAMEDMRSVMSRIDRSGEGVYIQASTFGSLEALLEFLKTDEVRIPVSGIGIGPVHKKDVMKASVMLEKKKEYATILAFDVKVTQEAQELADEAGVKNFIADIIYHLFDQFKAYIDNLKEEKKKEVAEEAVFPCSLKIVPNHVYNKKDPIVVGVDVLEGIARVGTPICIPQREFIDIGQIASIENNHRPVDSAKKGQRVSIKIVGSNCEEIQKMFGRHFEMEDDLVSKVSRRSIDILKANFRNCNYSYYKYVLQHPETVTEIYGTTLLAQLKTMSVFLKFKLQAFHSWPLDNAWAGDPSIDSAYFDLPIATPNSYFPLRKARLLVPPNCKFEGLFKKIKSIRD
ncbi:hypothetical protein KY290_003788 [Solanum tuberosum]|uniref:Uncharacterized protein n=1 Tax=Solanum tuberosum TaxID=4113 RepID=A0ABQ7WUE5_SOLTU|nr:hypothetical protein KY290_003788 [Solanum tuberosum]